MPINKLLILKELEIIIETERIDGSGNKGTFRKWNANGNMVRRMENLQISFLIHKSFKSFSRSNIRNNNFILDSIKILGFEIYIELGDLHR